MDVIKLQLGSANRMVTPEQALALLDRDPRQAAKTVRGGITIKAEPADLEWLRTTAIGQYIDDDGGITSAATGVEEVIAALIVGACIGFLVGLGAGLSVEQGSGTGPAETEAEGEEEGGGDASGEGGTDPE